MSSLVDQILEVRGYQTAAEQAAFLSPDYEAHSHDPLLLPDMKKATKRIKQAIDSGQKIVIYGDYDIDGLSATALLLDALKSSGAKVSAYIPDRFEEGYGINTAALKQLQKQGAQLVITVDCGSTSMEPITWAAENGLDVIVTDHHQTPEQLPPAVAVINPKRPDSQYPFTDLAGVGVAFKLVQALQRQYGLLPLGQEKWLLDLVALGTVCDVVSLTGENRVLVTYGLKVFPVTKRRGLRALARVAGLDLKAVKSESFGFILGPRLNAAGRLEHAKKALEVFTTNDDASALAAAENLDLLNSERRRQQAEIAAAATAQAESFSQDDVLVLSSPDWNHGIVGIVAAKLVERYHKPAVVLQELETQAKGSARSLGEFNIAAAFKAASDILEKHGGHHLAAGCTLEKSQVPALRQRLNEYYRQQSFGQLYKRPAADLEVEDLTGLDLEAHYRLQQLEPFGMGNPPPLFFAPSLKLTNAYQVGADKKHLKLSVSDGKRQLEAIAFGQGHRLDGLGQQVKLWFELAENSYNGNKSLQLMVKEVV